MRTPAWALPSKGTRATRGLLLLVALLLAIWPLPNTLALRHVLLLGGTTLALPILVAARRDLCARQNWNLWLFLGFYAWLLIHFFLLSVNMEEQTYELRGDWLRSLLAVALGLALALRMVRPPGSAHEARDSAIFVAGLAGTIAIYMGRYFYEVVQTGVLVHTNFYWQPYLGKTPLVVFGSVLLCGIFARLTAGLNPSNRTPWLVGTGIGIACVAASYYFSNTKNGFIVFLLVFCIYTVKLFLGSTRKRWTDHLTFAVILCVLTAFLSFHIQANPSWLNFFADVKAGQDIDTNQYWKDAEKYPLPTNARGVIANQSTYERSAWATAGMQLVKEHPLGYGLINHSFGALALERWPDFYKPIGKYRHASHSGWLDFTLGFGLPGLLLVLIPLWVAFRRAALQPGFWFAFVRWSVPIVSVVYLITEVCTGHFIEFLFFYIALVTGITLKKKDV